jgi:hypothetical protein
MIVMLESDSTCAWTPRAHLTKLIVNLYENSPNSNDYYRKLGLKLLIDVY